MNKVCSPIIKKQSVLSSDGNVTAKKKYVTLKNGGCDFRKLARIMSNAGYKMNHATARNQLILAIESLISQTSANLNVKVNKGQMRELITNQALQDNLADVLFTAYEALKEEDQQKTSSNVVKGKGKR